MLSYAEHQKVEDQKIIKLLQGILKTLKKEKSPAKVKQPTITPRASHAISRTHINSHALKVLYRLHNAGFRAYLVGGCVRDLLLGRHPKDFDVATNALPEEVRQLFKNSRIIGKRFRLVHIVFGKEIIEVATFRTHHENAHEHHGRTHKGMIIRDNVYGDIHDDVQRRDFTINALYYNIADFSVVDYVDGMQDIQQRLLRIIGDPDVRFHEDPVRLLRAVRIMGKLNLNISPETESAITRLHHLLQNVSSARIFQEVLKYFQEGATFETFKLLQKYKLFTHLFPLTSDLLHQPETYKLITVSLQNTDERTKEGKSISASFLLAVFMWRPVLLHALRHEEEGMPPYVAVEKGIQHVMQEQVKKLEIPRRLLITVREICMLQHRFTQRQGSRAFRTLNHPRFRAGYDLLMLREHAGENVKELALWWTQFSAATDEQQKKMLNEIHKKSGRKKSHSSRRKHPRAQKIPDKS